MPSSNTSHSLNNSVLSTVVVSGTANGSQSSFIGSVTSSSNLQDTTSTLLNNAAASPNTGNPKPGGATSFAGQSTKSSSWASATSYGSRTGSQTVGASSTSASAPDRLTNNGFGLWNNSSSSSDTKTSKDSKTTSTTWSSSSPSSIQTSIDNKTTSTSNTTNTNRIGFNDPHSAKKDTSITASLTTKVSSYDSSGYHKGKSHNWAPASKTTSHYTKSNSHSTPASHPSSLPEIIPIVESLASSVFGDLTSLIHPSHGSTPQKHTESSSPTSHTSSTSSAHSNTSVSHPSTAKHIPPSSSSHSRSHLRPPPSHTRQHIATSTNYLPSSPLSHWPPNPSLPPAQHSHPASSTTQTSRTGSGAETRTKNRSSSANDPLTGVVPPFKAGAASGSGGGVRSSTVNSSGKNYEVVTTTSSTIVSTFSHISRSAIQDDAAPSSQLTAYTTVITAFTTSVHITITTGTDSGSMTALGTIETRTIVESSVYKLHSSTPTTNGSSSPLNKHNLGPLVGGIVGAVVALILLSFTICFVLRRKRRLRDQEYTAPLSPGPDTATIRDMHQFAATPVLVPAESPFADSTFIEHRATPSDLFYSVQGSDYESTEYYSDARQSVDSLFTSQIDLAASHGFLPSDVAFPTLEEVGRAVEYPYINAPRRIIYSDTTSTERSLTTSINSFSTFTPAVTENPFIGEDHGAQTPTLDISSERPSLARTWSDQQRVAASWAAALAAASPVDPKDVSNQYMTNPFIDPSEDGHSIKTTSTDDSLQTTLQARPVELHRNRLSSASSGVDIPSDPSQCGIAL